MEYVVDKAEELSGFLLGAPLEPSAKKTNFQQLQGLRVAARCVSTAVSSPDQLNSKTCTVLLPVTLSCVHFLLQDLAVCLKE